MIKYEMVTMMIVVWIYTQIKTIQRERYTIEPLE